MPGVFDSWTNELTKLRTQTQTILSSGSNQADDQSVRSDKNTLVESKSPTIIQFMRDNLPLKFYYSESALSMMSFQFLWEMVWLYDSFVSFFSRDTRDENSATATTPSATPPLASHSPSHSVPRSRPGSSSTKPHSSPRPHYLQLEAERLGDAILESYEYSDNSTTHFMEKCRVALSTAAELPGVVIDDTTSEARIVEDVVRAVLQHIA
ncbi:hypothetical protein ACET3Z_021998 [Daucus carota]